jgi:hypothetical protein
VLTGPLFRVKRASLARLGQEIEPTGLAGPARFSNSVWRAGPKTDRAPPDRVRPDRAAVWTSRKLTSNPHFCVVFVCKPSLHVGPQCQARLQVLPTALPGGTTMFRSPRFRHLLSLQSCSPRRLSTPRTPHGASRYTPCRRSSPALPLAGLHVELLARTWRSRRRALPRAPQRSPCPPSRKAARPRRALSRAPWRRSPCPPPRRELSRPPRRSYPRRALLRAPEGNPTLDPSTFASRKTPSTCSRAWGRPPSSTAPVRSSVAKVQIAPSFWLPASEHNNTPSLVLISV